MKKFAYNIMMLLGAFAVVAGSLTSCSEEPDDKNFHHEESAKPMISVWFQQHPDYSMFSQIMEKAGLLDQMSAYGKYTCFAPDNDAVAQYLAKKGKSIGSLTVADCDTIARTHLVTAMYSTDDMPKGVLPELNMMKRPVNVSFDRDAQDNSVVMLNSMARIYHATRNDSVQNGIMQPVDAVMESSNDLLPDLIKKDESVSIFYEALVETGVAELMSQYKDDSYIRPDEYFDYKSGAEPLEYATAPDERLIGFTAFLVPDEVLKTKYNITSVEDLYHYACSVYDNIEGFKQDASKPEHEFINRKSPINPLYRLMAYHVLKSKVMGYNLLNVRDDFGVVTSVLNPIDWYYTLLPYCMMRIDHLTVTKWVGEGIRGDRYINRRYDDVEQVEGIHIQPEVNAETNDALNGVYFYADDIAVFDPESPVFNTRIRMDMSTVFPELATNNIRMNGDRTKTGEAVDHNLAPNGRNYFFPNGYLDGVNVGGNGHFVYRRPRQGYWSLHGDEFICQGDYDITFRIPPVPFEGDWQVRLGYAAMRGIRGIAQIYFGDDPDPDKMVPQGIPLDMNLDLRDILYGKGSGTDIPSWSTLSQDKKDDERKTLKNKGYYRGTNGGYRTGGTDQQRFVDIYATLRIVLCTPHMQPGKDYYLRIRAVSSKSGNDNEAMLDYLELVPKSVYGVSDGDAQEDDL